jgi:hypothetical protein
MDPKSAVSLATTVCEIIESIYVTCETWGGPPGQIQDLCNELVGLQHVLLGISCAVRFETSKRRKSRYRLPQLKETMKMTQELLANLLKRFSKPPQGWRGIAKQRLSRIFNNSSIEYSGKTVASHRKLFDSVLAGDNPATINRLHLEISQLTMPNNLPKRERMQLWLGTFDPYVAHTKFLASHQPGTGTWFVDDGELTRWLQADYGPDNFLWLQGKSGSGKSCLTAHTIDKMADRWEDFPNRAVLYFHCNFPGAGLRSLLGSLVVQMCHTDTAKVGEKDLWGRVEGVYHAEEHGSISIDRLQALFRDVAKNFEQIVIFLDAPNEASDSSLLVNTLATEARRHRRMQICVSATPDLDMKPLRKHGLRCLTVTMDDIGQRHDLEAYVEKQLDANITLSYLDLELKKLIVTKIVDKSDGSFRYADLHLTELTQKTTLQMFEQLLLLHPRP